MVPSLLPTVVSAFGSNHFLVDRFAAPGSVIATQEPDTPVTDSLERFVRTTKIPLQPSLRLRAKGPLESFV